MYPALSKFSVLNKNRFLLCLSSASANTPLHWTTLILQCGWSGSHEKCEEFYDEPSLRKQERTSSPGWDVVWFWQVVDCWKVLESFPWTSVCCQVLLPSWFHETSARRGSRRGDCQVSLSCCFWGGICPTGSSLKGPLVQREGPVLSWACSLVYSIV